MTDPATAQGVNLAPEAFARLVGRTGPVLLFEVDAKFADEDWSEPVRYRFVRSEGGLLSMELQRVAATSNEPIDGVPSRVSAYTEPKA